MFARPCGAHCGERCGSHFKPQRSWLHVCLLAVPTTATPTVGARRTARRPRAGKARRVAARAPTVARAFRRARATTRGGMTVQDVATHPPPLVQLAPVAPEDRMQRQRTLAARPRAGVETCTNNGGPQCILRFGGSSCNDCAHEECCSDIASRVDDPACCGLAACYGSYCVDATERRTSKLAAHTRGAEGRPQNPLAGAVRRGS